jgi:hypothetical protein
MVGSQRPHPVYVVHRVSAAALGLGLWVFAALGFARSVPFLSTQGQLVLGLSSDGALSTISLVAGGVLIAGAVWGGPVASTISVSMGVLFLLSGLVHLGVLNTRWNVFAFRLSNVWFSLIVGFILLVLGFYGRATGGLPTDNPYRRAREQRRAGKRTSLGGQAGESEESTEELADKVKLLHAEMAMGEGDATPEQVALVKQDQAKRRARTRAKAYRNWKQQTRPGEG